MGLFVLSLVLVTGLSADDGFVARARAADAARRALDASTNVEERGRNALRWMRAVMATFETIPHQRADDDIPARRRLPEPYYTWVKTNHVHYNEIEVSWQPELEPAWALHATVAGSSSADALAWLIVSIGMTGECEGDIACQLRWENSLQGEYLRRHPSGAHVEEALKRLSDLLPLFRGPFEMPNYFDATTDCEDIRPLLDRVRKAIAGTAHPDAAPILAGYDRLARLCSAPRSISGPR